MPKSADYPNRNFRPRGKAIGFALLPKSADSENRIFWPKVRL